MKSNPRIVELDFGMGNIRSLQKAFESFGQNVEVIKTPEKISTADAVVIPGDGAFGKAMDNIKSSGFYDSILEFIKSGKPVLGICIGFQILFQNSEEFGYKGNGFSIMEGNVQKFTSKTLNIPHMGWNIVEWTKKSPLTHDIPDRSYFYFVHSYRISGNHPNAIGLSEYDGKFTAAVQKENIYGVQFHPEKSHNRGLQLLKNFVDLI
jgi:glutamine amidotransferase